MEIVMENRLTLEHLAGYLPYGLQAQYRFTSSITNHSELRVGAVLGVREGISTTEILINNASDDPSWFDTRYIKLVLTPITDLNDSELMSSWGMSHDMELRYGRRLLLDTRSVQSIDILGYPLQFITELYKHHYDIHNLIEKGLAIKVNNLNLEV